MKTLAELQAIRQKMQGAMASRGAAKETDTKVVIGMATCGIAAGARGVLTEFNNVLAKNAVKNVVVTQTGCIGQCSLEPIVEIIAPDSTKTTYVKVSPQNVTDIVLEHILGGKVVERLTLKE